MQDVQQFLVDLQQFFTGVWGLFPGLIACLVLAANIPVIVYNRSTLTNLPTVMAKMPLDRPQAKIIPQLFSAEYPDRNCVVGVVIPNTRHRNIPADNSEYVKQSKCLFASQYGGYTAFNAEGGWILEDLGQLIEEPGVLVLALVTKAELNASQEILEGFALYLKQELDQEAVSIILNGNLKFI